MKGGRYALLARHLADTTDASGIAEILVALGCDSWQAASYLRLGFPDYAPSYIAALVLIAQNIKSHNQNFRWTGLIR